MHHAVHSVSLSNGTDRKVFDWLSFVTDIIVRFRVNMILGQRKQVFFVYKKWVCNDALFIS